MHKSTLAPLLIAGLVGGMAVSASVAAGGEERRYVDQRDAERLREQACREALDTASRLSEKFRAMSRDLARRFARTGEEAGREVAPALRELADRLHEMARQLERRGSPDTI